MNLLIDYSWLEIAAILAIFIVGGIIKGALGFGLPLATMAVLPFVVPVEVALAVNALVLPFTNLTQFIQAKRIRQTIHRFRHVIGGIVVGVPLGAYFVTSVDDHVLMLALGAFVILFTVLNVLNPRLAVPAARDREIGAGVGVLAGAVGALTTANGPIFVMYLVGLKVERAVFVSTLALLFIVSGVLISGSFWIAGMMDVGRLALALLCMPAALVGMRIGDWLAGKIAAEQFRLLVLGVLCILGVNLAARGAGAF